MSELIGAELGPYRIIEQIGTGGMATVYKAYHAATDRYVAVKILTARMSGDNELRKRFQRECKVIAKLEHARVVPVYDYGRTDDRLYLVTRYIEAGTLKDRLAQGSMSLAQVGHIMQQVGGALAYAHRLGVVHRDVKPSNVLLDAEGDCYLTDFGLARIIESSARLTMTGVGVGTPAYMSPEQGQGEGVDARSDIYSLGVMLYEMVTGQVPYQAETPLAVVLKHISAPLPLPRSVRPDIPEEVERVIMKAMAKNPADRFQAVGEMVVAFNAAVRPTQTEIPNEMAVVETTPAEMVTPPAEGFLSRAAARVREVTQTGWGRTAMWAAIGTVALLAVFLILNRVIQKSQFRDGPLEAPRIVETTATPETIEVATSTVTPVPTIPSEEPHTPVSTLAPTRTPGTPTATLATLPSSVTSLRWEQLTDAADFMPVILHVMAVHPNDPDIVYAGTYGAGIYVSRDGGQTWTPSSQGLGKGTVGSIAIDPNDPNIVYAGLFDQGGVFRSTDGGQSWEAANTGLDLDSAWDWGALVEVDRADSQRLYYSGCSDGLYLSTDGGQSWRQQGGHCPMIVDFAVDPADAKHLYAASHAPASSGCRAGVFETTDGGQTWKELISAEEKTLDDGEDDTWHIVTDPRDFDTIYAGGRFATFKSSDGGLTWTQVLGEGCQWLATHPESSAVYCGQGEGMRISRDGGVSWSAVTLGGQGGWRIKPFASAPSAPQTLYAGSNMVFRSDDGGKMWLPVGRLGAARMRLIVDPRDASRLFLSGMAGSSEAYRSEDGGRTWQAIVTDDGGCAVVIDPAQGILYRPTDQGLTYSKDNGQTWEQLGSGDYHPWLVEIDPQDSRKLWATEGCGSPPLLSQDGGVTFVEVESFPNEVCGNPIVLAHPDGKRVYVEDNGHIHRSDDGGETWRSMVTLGGMYRAAVLDPSDPDVLYVGSTHKGVLKTASGGHTWSQVNDGLTNLSIDEIAVDPNNPQTVYVATAGGAFVSMDGGGQWWPVHGGLGPNPIVYSIAVDSSDSSKVYAATPDGIFRLVSAPPAVAVATPVLGSTAKQVRAFAETILATIVDREPTWSDDFGDPGSGWPIGLTSAGDAWGYKDSAYFILLTPLHADTDGDNAISLRPDRAPWFSDFVLEVDARFISGESGHWDVGFRQSESRPSSYWMDLSLDGAFELHKTLDEDGTELMRGQDVSAFGQGFGTTNHLTIIAQGPWIVVYVNGQLLCATYDESLSEGQIVLGAYNRADTSLEVQFDNLKIWDISEPGER